MKTSHKLPKSAIALLAGLFAYGSANSASDPVMVAPISYTQGACAIYGDFVSCSTQLLEQFIPDSKNSWTIPVGPGQLQNNIVIGDNPGSKGSAVNDLNNEDLGSKIDNGFQTWTGGQEAVVGSFSTKLDTTIGGPLADPTPTFTGDLDNFWDIAISDLLSFLLIDGKYHELLIAFDHNQTGDGSSQNLLAWAKVVLTGADQTDLVLELTNSNYQNPLTWTSGKDIDDEPLRPDATNPFATPNDFVISNGQLCVNSTTFALINVTKENDCKTAGGYWADANKGNNIDFILWAYELNAAIYSGKYDMMHVRWDMTQLNDGAETAFLMPGNLITHVPEPGTLALLGIALLGLFPAVRSGKTKA